ncbi:DUF378 domain-containing protein [Candidatus Microgenomates bacterium]|nr:DUF378 domain-containing protein [Candidatus Microgenomates bacterium]
MKMLHIAAYTLLWVGGLNWLLVAFNFNLVETLLGTGSMLTNVVYILVGLSTVYIIAAHKSDCKVCGSK